MSRKSYTLVWRAAVVLALLTLLAAPLSAFAAPPVPKFPRGLKARSFASPSANGPFEVVASGLNNPRGLAFGPEGALYVAEAGTGGTYCIPVGPEGGPACTGPSGSVTRINLKKGTQERVGTGLSSIADPDGSFALGPADISFQGRGNGYVIVGLGGDPAKRDTMLGDAGPGFGQLVRMPASGKWNYQVDVAQYEAHNNPDAGEVDSDPYAVLALSGDTAVVSDAGGNDLLRVNTRSGAISTLAVFPDRMVDAPPFLGLPPGTQIPMQAVPTTVAVGPDGAYYVGQLTGFPFPVGAANIYRVPAGGGAPVIYASGFTNIIDIAFGPDGNLYVLQIFKNGLLSGDLTGALIRVAPGGTRTEIASDGWVTPAGVAFGPDGAIYVTNFSVFPSAGQVVKITP